MLVQMFFFLKVVELIGTSSNVYLPTTLAKDLIFYQIQFLHLVCRPSKILKGPDQGSRWPQALFDICGAKNFFKGLLPSFCRPFFTHSWASQALCLVSPYVNPALEIKFVLISGIHSTYLINLQNCANNVCCRFIQVQSKACSVLLIKNNNQK